jgi:hypothetical protein
MAEFNFGLVPQYLGYDELLYETYKEYFSKKCYVVFGVDLFYFACDLDKNKKYNSEYEKKYLQFLKIRKTIFRSVGWSFAERYFPVLHHPKDAIKIAFGIKKYNKEKSILTDEEFMKGATGLLKGWKQQFNLENFQDGKQAEKYLDVFEKNINIMKSVIDDCLDKGFRPIIVCMPVSEYVSSQISNDLVKSFLLDNVTRAAEDKALVLNYWNHDEFSKNKCYFNGHCMTGEYAKKFTDDVKERI